ncbi:MAG: signal recognition particle-docking protein FtsY [Alphaproteobacteria bacterium]|nr:signal recognition particle-docking protein FtsY [Alphaproteobacteria bacterium]
MLPLILPTATADQTLVPSDAVDTPDATPWLVGGGVLLALVVGAVLLRGRQGAGRAVGALEDRELPGTPDLATAQRPAERVAPVAAEPAPVGLAARLAQRMARTREVLQGRLDTLFGREVVDAALLEGLEETLLVADVGVPTTERLVGALRSRVKAGETDPAALRTALREEVRGLLGGVHAPFALDAAARPFVLLVVGVNGSGKTTTIGKLAARWGREGHKVLLAAGDTFRAAAAEQLGVWAERAGADLVRQDEGADPAAVVYDALDAALARGSDVVIVDTAGRLQTKRPLMEQLTKVRRVIDKKVPGAPHATLLVVDGTMGQNAMSQARTFHEATPLTGVVVTKLDGTAKGGMVLALAAELGLPVAFLGIGEQVDDLRPFEVDAFVDAIV